MAYLLDSVVKFFVKYMKVNRIQGILLTCMVVLIAIGTIFYILLPKLIESINNIASYLGRGEYDVTEIINNIKNKINNEQANTVANYILEANENVKTVINNILSKLSSSLMKSVSNIGSSMVTIVTSFIINIYMLSEKEELLNTGRRFVFAFLDEKCAKKTIRIFQEANKVFKSFINGKLIDSTIVGVMCVIAFIFFKIPYATLLGLVIGLFNVIPYFGPIIGSVPVVLVSFFIDPPKALTAIIIILVIQQIDGNFLDPRIVGRNVGVSPFYIITSVTIGGRLFGIPGMLIGVPTVVLFKNIIEQSVEMRLIEKRLDEEI